MGLIGREKLLEYGTKPTKFAQLRFHADCKVCGK